jgi:hypothetical protein
MYSAAEGTKLVPKRARVSFQLKFLRIQFALICAPFLEIAIASLIPLCSVSLGYFLMQVRIVTL